VFWVDVFGLTAECPKTEPFGDTSWNKYGGDSDIYHCGFSGYLENRKPNEPDPSPTGECFYDECGWLVDESHEYSGCRGTPDENPVGGFSDCMLSPINCYDHFRNDSGGPAGPSNVPGMDDLGDESKAESDRYRRDRKPRYRRF
jgi:hypothetical protein